MVAVVHIQQTSLVRCSPTHRHDTHEGKFSCLGMRPTACGTQNTQFLYMQEVLGHRLPRSTSVVANRRRTKVIERITRNDVKSANSLLPRRPEQRESESVSKRDECNKERSAVAIIVLNSMANGQALPP